MKFAAIIYDSYNIIVRVEERPTLERAIKAGKYYTRTRGWFQIAKEEEIEMYKALINA